MMIPLFSAPHNFARRALEELFPVLDLVMPMTGQQRRDLPLACRDLSALLTTERDGLARPYWTSPRLTSAYLRYFLPWNLVRLSALLPGLDFGNIPEEPLILDMGSGPLTLPLALWISRPDLRSRPVTLVASDTTPHILELGREIFEHMRERLDNESPWTIRTMRAPVALAPRRLYAKPGALWLASMGNVLNEMEERRAKPGHRMGERMRELLESTWDMLGEGGLILAVEPGTRQGGRLIAHLRKSALGGVEEESEFDDLTAFALREEQAGKRFFPDDEGVDEEDGDDFGLPPLFTPLAPCPHAGRCPMLDRRSTAWCHVNAPAEGAPEALRTLSAKAGLDKDSISLSFLALRKLEEGELPPEAPRPKAGPVRARIVSDAFVVPGYPGRARYACTNLGLALIPASSHLPPGALCSCLPTRERDMKSRAAILRLEDDAPHNISFREHPRAEGRREGDAPREKGGEERRPFPQKREGSPFPRREQARRERGHGRFPEKSGASRRPEGSRGPSRGGKKPGK